VPWDTSVTDSILWDRVGQLADEAPRLSDLRHHRLQLIAASRMRSRGEDVPAELVADERRAAVGRLAIPALLRRVRAVCDGPVALMKGAEVAARWPRPDLRPVGDVDLLVEDPETVQAALLSAGFVELEPAAWYRHLHHCAPLVFPGLPVAVEIHRWPHWYRGTPPDVDEILAAAQPCALGIDGILAPRPDHHAVLLVAHAWVHDPLDRIGPLADVAAMVEAAGHEAAASVAARWGVSGPWRATMRAVDQLLGRHSPSRPLPLWKRHLAVPRERTVLESHVSRVVAPVVADSIQHAPVAFCGAVMSSLRRAPGDTWKAKVSRSAQAVRHAGWTRSHHEASVAPAEDTPTGPSGGAATAHPAHHPSLAGRHPH
jgi:hypothetical protein